MEKILLIDDDIKIRAIYREVLESEGYQVIESGDWNEATSILPLHRDTHIVLLDINMPEMSGDELFNAIRLYNPKIRIIMFSVCPVDEQRHLVYRADDYFDKSDGTEKLIQKVKRIIACDQSRAFEKIR